VRFETALSDLARRFQNLETLQKGAIKVGKGFEALKITVSEPDGRETHEVVWGDDSQAEQIEALIEQVLGDSSLLKDNPALQKFFPA
jgi:hypothetical protein